MSALIRFYGNMVVIYELEDKMVYIWKLQIDCDFWQALYIRNEIQQYKSKIEIKGLKVSRANSQKKMDPMPVDT